MKKGFNKLITVLLVLVLTLSLSACGKKEAVITGTWVQSTSLEEYVLNSDGTGTHKLSGFEPINIEYKVDGSNITISETILGKKTDATYTFKLEEKQLTLTSNGNSAVFERK